MCLPTSGTPVHNTRASQSLFMPPEERPARSSQAVLSCVGAVPCSHCLASCPAATHLLLTHRTRGGPVKVPPVTSAPEHLCCTPWHKGPSVRASLHAGQRGGSVGGSLGEQLVPGWPRCPWLLSEGGLTVLCGYPWEGVHWKEGCACGE